MKHPSITVRTDPGKSYARERNITCPIRRVMTYSLVGSDLVVIKALGAAIGIMLNSAFCITLQAMDELALRWLSERGVIPDSYALRKIYELAEQNMLDLSGADTDELVEEYREQGRCLAHLDRFVNEVVGLEES